MSRVLERAVLMVVSFSLTTLALGGLAWAQSVPPPDDDSDKTVVDVQVAPPEPNVQEVVTTGMRVTQGGAKDINFFRGAVSLQRIPKPEDLTAEGLLSEHDIVLPSPEPCAQLFCLTAEATRADLIAKPEAQYLVGLGFTSNLDEKKWRRQPLNLVAVVDKSGSMEGHPLDMVKLSLGEVLKQLGPDDQLSIVLYGDRAHVHLPPTRVASEARNRLQKSIDAIESQGSTSMEAGLNLGYRVASESAAAFTGVTRVMLFTDERPNVGATDASSFMGMAIAASKNRVGLTTIGVGIQFGADLATRISSVRGGNLYFIRDKEDVQSLYAGQLDYMVSELAHDLRIVIRPHAGYRVAGVYGVPGELLGWQGQESVAITVPTVFLSNKGGGIFFALSKAPDAAFLPAAAVPAGERLASAEVTYVPVGSASPGRHSIAVSPPAESVSAGMQTGRMLIDEFLVLHAATTAHYQENNQEKAYQLVRAFAGRLASVKGSDFDGERKLVRTLDEQFTFLSGHSSEGAKRSNFALLWGKWEVTRVEGEAGYSRKDVLQFTPDNQFRVTYAKPRDERTEDEEEYEYSNRQVLLSAQEIAFDYRVSKDRLTLKRVRSDTAVYLKRAQ